MWGGNQYTHRIQLPLAATLQLLMVCISIIFASIQPKTIVESWSPPSILSLSTRQFLFLNHHRLAKSFTPSNRESACDRTASTLFAGTAFDILDDCDDNGDSGENDEEEQQYMEIESLSANQILELIELSFFQACFALSKGDLQPLGLFVVAVKTASKKYEGASALAISECVDALPPSVRPLETQERKLRETWIRAIYLLLSHVMEDFSGGPPESGDDDDDDDEVTKTYGPILIDLIGLHQTGMGLNANQFVAARKDLLFPKTNFLVLDDEKEEVDPVQLAVVTQTINVLFTTLEVLEEEQQSSDKTMQEEIQPPKSSKPSKKNKGTKPSSSSGRGFG